MRAPPAGKAAVRAEISIASITESLLRIAKKAEQLRDASGLSVARNAWMDAAKVNGLIIDKAENTNRNVDPNSLSDAELTAVISGEPIDVEQWQAQQDSAWMSLPCVCKKTHVRQGRNPISTGLR